MLFEIEADELGRISGWVVPDHPSAQPSVTVALGRGPRRDLPAIQGSVLFLSVIFVLVNLLTDLAYAKADKRVNL